MTPTGGASHEADLAAAARDPWVAAALARGFMTREALSDAVREERALRAGGRSPGLLPLLAQRWLAPAQVDALRAAARDGTLLGSPAPAPPRAPAPSSPDAEQTQALTIGVPGGTSSATVAPGASQAWRAPGVGVTHHDAVTGPSPAAHDPDRATLAASEAQQPGTSRSTEGGGAWAPGTRVDRWVVERVLGRGGMGAVLAAVEPEGGGRVAIKTLLPGIGASAVERFRREGVAQARVDQHPNIARVFGSGEHQGSLYLVLELCEGGDLARRLRDGPLPLEEGLRLGVALAAGLAHVHARGILHRDLKPANVLFDAEGTPKLVDFGVAKLAGEGALTRTADMVGTPSYMAPEQTEGSAGVDERTDVYGLGALLYEALTGEPPFRGDSVPATIKQLLTEDAAAPSARRPDLPADLDRVLLKALAKDPADRYPTARAFGGDLGRLLRGEGALGEDTQGARRRAAARGRALRGGALVGGAAAALAALHASWPAIREFALGREAVAVVPPTLSLELVHPKEATRLAWATVRGRLEGDADLASARLLVNDRSVPVEVSDWRAFEVDIPLVPDGRNAITLEVRAGARSFRSEPCVVTTKGWQRLLPRDLAPTNLHGEPLELDVARERFRNPRDGSWLAWVPPSEEYELGYDEDTDPLPWAQVAPEPPPREQQGMSKLAVAKVARREVTFRQGYLIGVHEVTWGQFARFQAATGEAASLPAPDRARYHPGWSSEHPVADVEYDEALAYCAWAGLELPTEAQWERAARGEERRRYPWGDDPARPGEFDRPLANVHVVIGRDEDGRKVWQTLVDRSDPTAERLVAVETFPAGASPFGCLHMAGNVWEWVRGTFAPGYAMLEGGAGGPLAPHDGNTPFEGMTPYPVARGGSYLSDEYRAGHREPEVRGHRALGREKLRLRFKHKARGKPGEPDLPLDLSTVNNIHHEMGLRVGLTLPP